MRNALVLSLVFIVVIAVSGCVEQEEVVPKYYDEALKMETEVTGEVLPSQGINLKVRLTNQVPDDVRDVKFEITDLYGLEVKGSSCGVGTEPYCSLGSIPSLDDKEINFILKVPSYDELARIGRELKPEITLKYNFDGETSFLVPILRKGERSTDARPQLIQTKGPIHADIQRGFTSSNYDWEWHDSGFSVIIRIKDVLSSDSQVTIDDQKFTVILTNLVASDEFGRCDLDGNTTLKYDKDITLPMVTPLVCALKAINTGAPWVYGEVKVVYGDYEYVQVETKSIMVETVIA